MFRQSRMVIIFLLAILLVPAIVRAVDLPVTPQPALRAAIFVQNRAGEQFSDKLEYLNDLITAGLTQKGFSIIDRHLVAAMFREEGRRDRELAAAMKESLLRARGENDPRVAADMLDAAISDATEMDGGLLLCMAPESMGRSGDPGSQI